LANRANLVIRNGPLLDFSYPGGGLGHGKNCRVRAHEAASEDLIYLSVKERRLPD
jgi:hypothetical protein